MYVPRCTSCQDFCRVSSMKQMQKWLQIIPRHSSGKISCWPWTARVRGNHIWAWQFGKWGGGLEIGIHGWGCLQSITLTVSLKMVHLLVLSAVFFLGSLKGSLLIPKRSVCPLESVIMGTTHRAMAPHREPCCRSVSRGREKVHSSGSSRNGVYLFFRFMSSMRLEGVLFHSSQPWAPSSSSSKQGAPSQGCGMEGRELPGVCKSLEGEHKPPASVQATILAGFTEGKSCLSAAPPWQIWTSLAEGSLRF